MAGNGKESRELTLPEKAPQAGTRSEGTVSRPTRERRPPDRYGFLDPDGKLSSQPKSLPRHSQAAVLPPPPPGAVDVQADDHENPDQTLRENTAAEERGVEEEETTVEEEEEEDYEVTHDYVQLESAALQPAPLPAPLPAPQPATQPASAPIHLRDVRPGRSRGKSDKREPPPRSKTAFSSSSTYASGSSRSSRRSQQVELTPQQAAMVDERRKLGELQEIQRQIEEEQAPFTTVSTISAGQPGLYWLRSRSNFLMLRSLWKWPLFSKTFGEHLSVLVQ
ncbi:titin-like [Eleginops maclovinus]|uniref:titin-like n=1 Tax=Eleginops maclovinus TaxID=56733 RepID=UPI00307FFF0F